MISDLFAARGVAVVDTDVISRGLLEPDQPAYHQVSDYFGPSILDSEHAIDRAKLREIVFSNPAAKSWLEKMLHPLIFQRSLDEIRAHARAEYVLVVIPLLFETNFQALVDRILVVDCPPETQMQRLLKRDRIDETLARTMLAQQFTNQQRLARAHDIIDNRSDESNLKTQVDKHHQQYLELAKI